MCERSAEHALTLASRPQLQHYEIVDSTIFLSNQLLYAPLNVLGAFTPVIKAIHYSGNMFRPGLNTLFGVTVHSVNPSVKELYLGRICRICNDLRAEKSV